MFHFLSASGSSEENVSLPEAPGRAVSCNLHREPRRPGACRTQPSTCGRRLPTAPPISAAGSPGAELLRNRRGSGPCVAYLQGEGNCSPNHPLLVPLEVTLDSPLPSSQAGISSLEP